jgi:putative phosphoribosyl transferase
VPDISLALRLPLDVFITRKLGTPSNPELAMGALAETGYRHINEDVIREYHVSKAEVDEEILCQESEIRRRIERYRGGRALPSLKGQTVILADDGIATGATFYASLGALLEGGDGEDRRRGAGRSATSVGRTEDARR